MITEDSPQRPIDGPAAPIETNITLLLNNGSYEQDIDNIDDIKKSETGTSYYNINNKTTVQMKSVSDFIKFSDTSPDIPTPKSSICKNINDTNLKRECQVESSDLPHVSALTPTFDQSTAPMKSISDFIKFSHDSKNLNTADMPDIIALMNQAEVSTQNNVLISNTISPHDNSTTKDVTESNDTMSSNDTFSNIDSHEVSIYQKSFPNIDISLKLDETKDDIFEKSNLINFKYEELKNLTNNFSEQGTDGSHGISGKIGKGGFGEVFVAVHPELGSLAIKRAHNELLKYRNKLTMELFNAEVKYLSQFPHKNIVHILGYSRDGPAPCIVCEFIDGGSLEHKIAAKVLSETQRIDIMIGTAEGLKYIHKSELFDNSTLGSQNTKRNNFVHGDIKSANILLTKDCIPKVSNSIHIYGFINLYLY